MSFKGRERQRGWTGSHERKSEGGNMVGMSALEKKRKAMFFDSLGLHVLINVWRAINGDTRRILMNEKTNAMNKTTPIYIHSTALISAAFLTHVFCDWCNPT